MEKLCLVVKNLEKHIKTMGKSINLIKNQTETDIKSISLVEEIYGEAISKKLNL